MAKIGTAHIELKPVLDEEALEQIAKRIEDAVRKGVEAGLRAAHPQITTVFDFQGRPFLDVTSINASADGAR